MEGLSVALQQPAIAADPQNICKIVQVCRAWREAVQQSNARITVVSFQRAKAESPDEVAADLRRLQQFVKWVSLYPGMIRSIGVNATCWHPESTTAQARDVLAAGLGAVGAAHDISSAMHGLAGHSNPCQAVSSATANRQRLFQIESFICGYDLVSSMLLSALPAASLTQLKILLLPQATKSRLAVAEELGKLSNLRSLHIQVSAFAVCPFAVEWTLDEYFSSLSNLTKLTDLFMHRLPYDCQWNLLPTQLNKLDLGLSGRLDKTADLDLSHLKHLQQLRAVCNGTVRADLPKGLQMLKLSTSNSLLPALSAFDIPSMQHLQRLKLAPAPAMYNPQPEHLLSLNNMQKLVEIDLRYSRTSEALIAAPTWGMLQHLVALELEVTSTVPQMAQLIEAISLLEGLTKLDIDAMKPSEDDDHVSPTEAIEAARDRIANVCRSLVHLTRLRKLRISLEHWVEYNLDDLMHLSNLTGLTCVSIYSEHFVGDTGAVAVLLELPELRDLTLGCFDQVYDDLLPTVGRLQGLTSLGLGHRYKARLSGQECLSALSHLTGLRNLQKLNGFESCDKAALRWFWNVLHS